MRYLSDDGKVFNTEQECCEYEQNVKKQRTEKELLEKKRQEKLSIINKKYEELQKLLSDYEKEYSVRQMPYIAPFYEILDMLCS